MGKGLYPLRFVPQYKERIWGGDRLKRVLGKDVPDGMTRCGESWEISAVEGSVSEVANGYLAGNTLEELVEVYMGDLVGDAVYERFGVEFPLLVKLIDAQDVLSIQVHPNDEYAAENHHAYGKTEMWYVLSSEPGSEIIAGFKEGVSKEEYLASLANGTLKNLLNVEKPKAGDTYFIPAGRVHALGKGVLLVEIQQTSDITYRIYDWDRLDANGKPRELHKALALDVIDFGATANVGQAKPEVVNKTAELVSCPYFTVNRLTFADAVERSYDLLDSFVIYMCLKGEASIIYRRGEYLRIAPGETVLLPAVLKNIVLKPGSPQCTLLEIYVK